MTDPVLVAQLIPGFQEKVVARIAARHHKVRRHSSLGRAHWPDMQVMNIGNTGLTLEERRYRARFDFGGTAFIDIAALSRKRPHALQIITATTIKLITGSIQSRPVRNIAAPATTTVAETAASAAM